MDCKQAPAVNLENNQSKTIFLHLHLHLRHRRLSTSVLIITKSHHYHGISILLPSSIPFSHPHLCTTPAQSVAIFRVCAPFGEPDGNDTDELFRPLTKISRALSQLGSPSPTSQIWGSEPTARQWTFALVPPSFHGVMLGGGGVLDGDGPLHPSPMTSPIRSSVQPAMKTRATSCHGPPQVSLEFLLPIRHQRQEPVHRRLCERCAERRLSPVSPKLV